jgi:hypothetical protein
VFLNNCTQTPLNELMANIKVKPKALTKLPPEMKGVTAEVNV